MISRLIRHNPSNTFMHRYDEYEEERATTVRTENKPVDVDFVVGSVLGTGGFGLVKDGVSLRPKLSKLPCCMYGVQWRIERACCGWGVSWVQYSATGRAQ